MRIKRSSNLPCPCGSGNKAKRCCLASDGTWWLAPSRTAPEAPQTSYGNPGCYARSLKDCDDQLTKEHYLTRRLFNEDGVLAVSGFPWQSAGQTQQISPGALQGHVLCRRHNHALRGIDAAAVRLFRGLSEYEAAYVRRRRGIATEPCLVSGHDLELWIVKVAMGVASLRATKPSGSPRDPTIHTNWAKVLFQREPMPAGCGLHVLDETVDLPAAQTDGLALTLQHREGSRLASGVWMRLRGLALAVTVPLAARPTDRAYWGSTYRPSVVRFNKEFEILLSWLPRTSPGGTVEHYLRWEQG